MSYKNHLFGAARHGFHPLTVGAGLLVLAAWATPLQALAAPSTNATPAGAAKIAAQSNIAVILDDSKGMCGYLKPSSAYAAALRVVQSQLEQSRMFAGARLSMLGKEGWEPAVARLDQLLSVEGSEKGGCPFQEGTSPLGRFFKRAEDAPVALMATDLIFDEGKGSGLAAGRTEFIEAALRWQQASPDNAGFGIVALRSAFTGNYHTGQRPERTIKISTDSRPVYLLWRAKRGPHTEQFVNDLLAALNTKALLPYQGKSFVLMPAVTESTRVSFALPLPLSEVFSGAGAVAGTKPPTFAYQLKDGILPPARPLVPGACLAWRDGQLQVDGRCSRGGPGVGNDNLSKLDMQVDWAHAVFDLGTGGGAMARKVARDAAGQSGDGGVRLCVTEVAAELLAEASTSASASTPPPPPKTAYKMRNSSGCEHVKVGSLRISTIQAGQPRTFAVVSVRPGAPVVSGGAAKVHTSNWLEQFGPIKTPAEGIGSTPVASIKVDEWNAPSEPCAAAPAQDAQCAAALKGTVGFESLVTALASRLDPMGRYVERLNAAPTAKLQLTVVNKGPSSK